MCGIIGYTGRQNAIPKITAGLSVLEYRGYDSAGLAAAGNGRITTIKCCGRVKDLEEKLRQTEEIITTCAIGHTRWATHGGVTDRNAHPHTVGYVTLVHNGIIENEKEWRERLTLDGYHFSSETDTEVAAALLNRAYQKTKDPLQAIYGVLEILRGSYAFAMIFADRTDEIYAVRQDSPLLIAQGEDGCYLASDLTALVSYASTYCVPDEGVVVRLNQDGIFLCYKDGTQKEPIYQQSGMQHAAAERGGYDTFMKKEICEQPQALRAALNGREAEGLPDFSINALPTDFFDNVHRIHIVACGSAMHAGLLGARLLERDTGIPTTIFIASEYRYHMPPKEEGTLLIAISQSGETADTLAALRAAKARGIPVLAIVNAENTAIAREAAHVLYTHAGPEIAVATTKGYCTQVALLWMISLFLSNRRKTIAQDTIKERLAFLKESAPKAISAVIARESELSHIAERLDGHDRLFYIGRGRDYALAAEGSLKLKEISYVHSEAYAAGELKHGTISLIEPGTPVIAFCTEDALAEKMLSNVREVASRGASVTVLCKASLSSLFLQSAVVFPLDCENDETAVFAMMTAMQLIAYETARRRGCDVDKPRNLAKSVTVE
ncbi:MAG: glutamine--fructose-6-phosphate transaminase (isomerizing) [Clostridia bacterium]|nr:glutamine--fructose-6-phosphate transaminase (isomerizing) [Clostridia bacterium]